MQHYVVVEDSADLGSLYRAQLAVTGDDGSTLRCDYTAERLFVVLLDVQLSRPGGAELLRGLSEIRPWVPVVILSTQAGYGDDFAPWLGDASFITVSAMAGLLEQYHDSLEHDPDQSAEG
jgi:hypothetical protein